MKYDYLAKQKYKPRKTWWEPTLSKKERSHYYQMILHSPSYRRNKLDEKDLFKHTLLEPLSFDIEKYFINNEKVENEPTFLLVHFDPANEKPTFTSIKQTAFQMIE